jgi:5-methylcytosine-specific restriction endonuclease McrA
MRAVTPKCECCGVPLKRGKRGPAGRYCSQNCRHVARYKRNAAEPKEGKCAKCGRATPVFVSSGRPHKHCHYCRLPVRDLITCTECGKQELRMPGVKTCSTKCSKARIKRRVAAYARPEKKCLHCGGIFRPKGSRLGYCSLRCGADARKERNGNTWERAVGDGYLWWATKWKKCRECGCTMFANAKQLLCSDECRREEARKDALVERVDKQCERCGKVFNLSVNTADRRPHCPRCVTHLGKKWQKGSLHRKRARKYGVTYEPINRRKLFERDNYKCWICGRTTRKDKKVPHHRAPTIDHIVAMSKGGSHTWDNVACACFICNSRKSSRKLNRDRQLTLGVVSP